MARFGDGFAMELDLVRAAESASEQALQPLNGRAPDLACVFVCGDDPAETADALERAHEVLGAGTTVGCTASGVLGGRRAAEAAPAVSVWTAVLPGAGLRAFHLEVLRTPESAVVVGMPASPPSGSIALLLADPYTFPADAFVERGDSALPGVALVGGLADGLRGAGAARLLLNGHVHDRGAVGVLLPGDAVIAQPVVSQGCRPVGPPMTVTAADGRSLLTLAGRPALQQLEELVAGLTPDDQALVSRGIHLGIVMDEYADEHGTGDFLVRPVVSADRHTGALVVGTDVEAGRTVRFHVRDADSASAELGRTLDHVRTQGPLDPVEGALLFSCNGRGGAMFADPAHDLLAVRAGLPVDGVAGFFAAGEIGPVAGRNHLHAFTASLLAFGTTR